MANKQSHSQSHSNNGQNGHVQDYSTIPEEEKPKSRQMDLDAQSDENKAAAEQETQDAKMHQIDASDAFVAAHTDRLQYIKDYDEWQFYNGVFWEPCNKFQHIKLVKKFLKTKTSNLHRESDCMAVLRLSRDGLSIDREDLNKNPLLVQTYDKNTHDGATIDFDYKEKNALTGMRCPLPPFPDYRITLHTNTMASLKPTKEWTDFVEECMPDEDTRHFLKLFFGQALLGVNVEQKFVFIYGPGGNGKSVFIQSIKHACGTYAGSLSNRYLISTRSDIGIHTAGLAQIEHKTLVVASEVPSNKFWNMDLIKLLTGGDTLSVQKMRTNYYEIRPNASVVAVGNEKPRIYNPDYSIERRLCLVPFMNEPEPNKMNTKLQSIFTSDYHAAGILCWLLEGADEYVANYYLKDIPLRKSALIDEVTIEYLNDQNQCLYLVTESDSGSNSHPFIRKENGKVRSTDVLELANIVIPTIKWSAQSLKTLFEKNRIHRYEDNKGYYYKGIAWNDAFSHPNYNKPIIRRNEDTDNFPANQDAFHA